VNIDAGSPVGPITTIIHYNIPVVSQSEDLGRSNNPNTTPTRDYEMCEWWFTSTVSREDVLRRGRGNLHQQGDAERDTGYS